MNKICSLILLFNVLFICNLRAANYYWIGGDGTPGGTYTNALSGVWGDVNNWRNAPVGGFIPSRVPTINDNVFINITDPSTLISVLTPEIFAKDLHFKGKGTLKFNIPDINAINCYGDFDWIGSGTLVMGTRSNINIFGSIMINPLATMNIQRIGSAVNMLGTGGNYTINTNNAFFNVSSFNISPTDSNSVYTFVSKLNTARLFISFGIVDFGNFTYDLSELVSNVAGPRTLQLNKSKFNLSLSFKVGQSGLNFMNKDAVFTLLNGCVLDYNSYNPFVLYHVISGNTGTNKFNRINSIAPPGTFEIRKLEVGGDASVTGNGILMDTLIYQGNSTLFLPSKDVRASGNYSKINKVIYTTSTACNMPSLLNYGTGYVDLRLGGNLTTDALATQNIRVTSGSLTVNNWADQGNNTNITGITSPISNDFYWVNTTGNSKWSDKNNWRLGSCTGTVPSCSPGYNDNAIINGCGPGQDKILMDKDGQIKNITWTNNVSTGQVILTGARNLDIFGDFIISKPGLNLSYTGVLNFKGINNQINTSNTEITSRIEINTVNTFEILSDLKVDKSIIQNAGKLITNDFNITAESFVSGDESANYLGVNNCKPARTLDLGNSTITLTASGSSNPLVIYAGNLTLPPNNSTFILSGVGTDNNVLSAVFYNDCQNKTLNWGNLYFTGEGNFTQSIKLPQVTQRNLFKNIRFSSNGSTNGGLTYDTLFIRNGKFYSFRAANVNVYHKINQTIQIEGTSSCDKVTYIEGVVGAINFRKSSGTLNIDKVILKNVKANGGAVFNATSSFDAGDVTGFNFIAPLTTQDYYWNNTNGGDWNNCNNWSIGSPTGPTPTVLPTPTSNVFFTIPLNDTIHLSSVSFCRDMFWNIPSGKVVFAGSSPLYIFGSLVAESKPKLNWTYNGLIYFSSQNNGNIIQMNGQNFLNDIDFVGDGQYSLQSDIDLSFNNAGNISYYNILLDKGELNTNGYHINAGSFLSTSSDSRTLILGSSTIHLYKNGLTFNGDNMNLQAGTSTFISNSMITIQNSGLNFYNLIFDENTTVNNLRYISNNKTKPLPFFNKVTFVYNGSISGNIIYDTLYFYPGKTYKIASNSIQQINKTLIASGTPCVYTTIMSTATGSLASFFKKNGSDIVVYQVNLNDIAGLTTNPLDGASTSATYNAIGTSFSNGNAPGWLIGPNSDQSYGFEKPKKDSLNCTDFPYLIQADNFFNPISYLWEDGSTQSTFLATSPGIHYLTVEYMNGCAYKDTVELVLHDSTYFSFNHNDPSCFNSLDGSITVIPGDAQLHQYEWQGYSDTTATLSGLSSGTYTVKVTKGICVKTDTASIFKDTIHVSLIPTDPGCLNNDGIIQAVVNNEQGSVSYTWNLSTIGDTSIATKLSGGYYSVSVKDANACEASADTSLIFIPLPTLTFNPIPDFCENDPTLYDLSTLVSPSGGIFFGSGVTGNDYTSFGQVPGLYDISYEISDSKNCKDTITNKVLVKDTSVVNIKTSICELDSFQVGTHFYSSAGTYSDLLIKSNGCDSTVNLELAIIPLPDTTFVPVMGCEGHSITLSDGSAFLSDTTHTIRFSSYVNCDSIVKFILTFVPKINTTVDKFICDGDTFNFGTHTLTTTGTYVDTFPSSLGCDSIVTLNLTVWPSYAWTNYLYEPCEGDIFTFPDGVTTTTDTIRIFTMSTIHGCDSIVQYEVRFKPIRYETINKTICENEYFDLNGTMLNISNTYYDTIPSSLNCDSIITLNLTVVPLPDTTIIDIARCEGDIYAYPDSSTITTDDTRDFKYFTGNNCDSIVRYRVDFVDKIRVTLFDTICSDASYTLGTQTLDSTGTYSEIFPSSLGCDSIVTLNLTVWPSYAWTNYLYEPCEGDIFTFPDGMTTTTDTIRIFTMSTIHGCDSIVQYEIRFKPIRYETINKTICENEYFDLNGTMLNISNTYYDTIPSSLNCDSIITLNLTVVPLPDTTIIDIARCEGDIYTYPDSSTITTDDTRDFKYFTGNNCDSIVRYRVDFVDKIRVTLFDTICSDASYTLGTQTLDSTGTYSETFPSSLGCDSIVTLHLQVNQVPPIFDISLHPCEGDTVRLPDNSIFVQNGVHDIHLNSYWGCDSTVRYTIQFIPKIRVTKDTSICEGQVYHFGTQFISSAGAYIETFSATTGCDSIVTLNMSIISINIVTDHVAICEDQFATLSIQNPGISNVNWWRDNVLLSDTTEKIKINTAGNYYAVAAQGTACRDTSNLVNIQVKPTPKIDLGVDKLICKGDTISFDATYSLDTGAIYQWNTGKQTAQVFETMERDYIVQVSLNNCTYSDTVKLNVQELPIVNLGPDFSACVDSTVTLSNQNISGQYLWSDGSSGKTLDVSQDGVYGLEVTQGICKNSDSVRVTFDLVPPVVELGLDTSFCVNKSIDIGQEVSNATSYLWNNGETTPIIEVNEPGTYQVQVANTCGSAIDSIHIEKENCECGVFMPKAFTPNQNGVNDHIAPIVTCMLDDYYYVVYNRWNKKVFESSQVGAYWDGTINGKQQPMEGYMYYIKYRLKGEDRLYEKRGTFLILH